MAAHALVLFAHGARDPRWADAFVAIAGRIRAQQPALPVTLAFLEHRDPDLVTALRELAGQGVRSVRVVPLFFGRGGHLREDLPVILEAARQAVPGLSIEVTEAAGEDPAVQEALVAFALRGLGPFSS